jgi:restriction system protein
VPVPDFQTLMLPVLEQFSQGKTNIAQCLPALQKQFSITDEEAAALNPSGTMTTFANRSHWARTYLSKAGLLTSPGRNRHEITEDGRRLLASGVTHVDMKTLEQFASYQSWRELDAPGLPRAKSDAALVSLQDSETPEERIERDHRRIEDAVVEEILEKLQSMAPVRFERLILDLLTKMGYGAGDLSNSQMTRASGDGGIDGIINEDALGLDAVYIQAKRYAPDSKVGRPALQAFVGSLTGEGANKGVFVTTSDFSREAKDYLNKVQHRIVLINGDRLARLMIAHEVGVRARKTYVLRSVDEDYFSEF